MERVRRMCASHAYSGQTYAQLCRVTQERNVMYGEKCFFCFLQIKHHFEKSIKCSFKNLIFNETLCCFHSVLYIGMIVLFTCVDIIFIPFLIEKGSVTNQYLIIFLMFDNDDWDGGFAPTWDEFKRIRRHCTKSHISAQSQLFCRRWRNCGCWQNCTSCFSSSFHWQV